MPLEISSAAIQEKNKLAGGSGKYWIVLLDIYVPGLEDNIRVTSDNEETVWNGNTYVPFPFEIEEISDTSKGEVPRVDIKVSNVTRAMEGYLQDYDYYTKINGYSPVELTISVVHSAHLDPTEENVNTEVLTSGTATRADTRLSLADGVAFFDASGPFLAYKGAKLTVTSNGTGKKITGIIKAAGSGETYGSELVTNGGFETGNPPTGWNAGRNATLAQTAGGQSGNCISLYNKLGAGAAASANRTITTIEGALYTASRYLKSGTAGANTSNFILYKAGYAGVLGETGNTVSTDTWSQAGFYRTATGTSTIVYLFKGIGVDGTMLFDTVSVKQVLTPSATGVTIVSSPGGSVSNWARAEAGFNYNDSSGYTYTIEYLLPETEYVFHLKQPKTSSKWATFTLGANNPFSKRFPLNRLLKNRCRYKQFRNWRCGYAGAETTCDRTLARCRELGNSERFGGTPGVGNSPVIV